MCSNKESDDSDRRKLQNCFSINESGNNQLFCKRNVFETTKKNSTNKTDVCRLIKFGV